VEGTQAEEVLPPGLEDDSPLGDDLDQVDPGLEARDIDQSFSPLIAFLHSPRSRGRLRIKRNTD